MATLYVVATPIGNLSDISLRALQILKSVDAIFCEDTRVTRKLLDHFEITKSVFAYHQHSGDEKIAHIARTLREGMALALVSDAGTPGINDPGGKLIQQLLEAVPDLQVIPIPGANAAVTALSVSAFPADRYAYWGFAPHKKGRQTFFMDAASYEDTLVFYESKHRITKTLEQLASALDAADVGSRPIVVARELTKTFETIYRGTAREVLQLLTGDKVLGEFVVILAPKSWK